MKLTVPALLISSLMVASPAAFAQKPATMAIRQRPAQAQALRTTRL
jgi:hypothetical protein